MFLIVNIVSPNLIHKCASWYTWFSYVSFSDKMQPAPWRYKGISSNCNVSEAYWCLTDELIISRHIQYTNHSRMIDICSRKLANIRKHCNKTKVMPFHFLYRIPYQISNVAHFKEVLCQMIRQNAENSNLTFLSSWICCSFLIHLFENAQQTLIFVRLSVRFAIGMGISSNYSQ